MILSEVIQSAPNWDASGYRCSDAEQYRRFHRFLREAVLDRHIPHYKVIGVSYIKSDKSIKRLRSFVNIEGNDSVGESFPELMLNLQDKVFIPKQEPTRNLQEYTCTAAKGFNSAASTKFMIANTEVAVPALYTHDRVCTVMNDTVILQLHVYYSCGYMDMSRASHLLNKGVFPFYVDYSLQNYIRILPPMPNVNDNVIHIRFYNGMTKEIFLGILRDWEKSLSTIDFGTEEKLWLQRSEH